MYRVNDAFRDRFGHGRERDARNHDIGRDQPVLLENVTQIGRTSGVGDQPRVFNSRDDLGKTRVEIDRQQPRIGRHSCQQCTGRTASARSQFDDDPDVLRPCVVEDAAFHESGTRNHRADIFRTFQEPAKEIDSGSGVFAVRDFSVVQACIQWSGGLSVHF